MTGYVKLYRSLLDHPLCSQLPAGWFRVWVVCLMLTNFRSSKWWNGTREVEIPAGSFVTSLPKLAAKSGVTVRILRRSLAYFLRSDMMVLLGAYSGRSGFRHLSIVNWETYQCAGGDATEDVGQVSGHDEGQIKGRLGAGLGQVGGTNLRSSVSGVPLVEEILQPQKSKPSEKIKIVNLWFEEWWPAYWRKKSRQTALAAFRKMVADEETFRAVMIATREQTPEMLRRPIDKRPYGATWLNAKGWTDEVENQSPGPKIVKMTKNEQALELFEQMVLNGEV